jgi:uncharacterized radical SAM protein YgiQ
MQARGWDEVDIVFVTGDAYVDHPSFAMAILHRVLENAGFRVGMVSQPDWQSCEPWRQFGKPRLFFAISAGNMDSLINHYTANKKVRNDDAYSPGGKIGLRPDRATLAYCQRAREAFPGVPIVAGGVEASLRRLAHYDYWSDTVRRSILLDAKADLLVYGMGESNIVEIAKRLATGKTVKDLRDLRGVAYTMGARESTDLFSRDSESSENRAARPRINGFECTQLPSFEEVKSDKRAFIAATRLIHLNTNPFNAAALVQFHDRQAVVATPPAFPLAADEMDRIYDLPYTRRPHPLYNEPIPAHEMIKDSVTIMRGCFGGCTFCSITAHQGRIIQSRSPDSIQKEVKKLAADPEFKGVISDIGGPTANMYQMRCEDEKYESRCRRLSCVHPDICKHLKTDHGPLIDLMKRVREEPGVKHVHIASGVRTDLVVDGTRGGEYLDELTRHHVGGQLSVAPEHVSDDTLRLMKKPPIESYDRFTEQFRCASEAAGKEQYLIPYFISGHPGSTLDDMIAQAQYLKKKGYRPRQVQDFIPTPMSLAATMYHTGIDPLTMKPCYTAKGLREKRMQKALLLYWDPEQHDLVREALTLAGRTDLIGTRPECLVPPAPHRRPPVRKHAPVRARRRAS